MKEPSLWCSKDPSYWIASFEYRKTCVLVEKQVNVTVVLQSGVIIIKTIFQSWGRSVVRKTNQHTRVTCN